MTSNQTLTHKEEIYAFKERILKTYGINIHIMVEERAEFKIHLDVLHACALKALKNNEPLFDNIESLEHRTRLRPYLVYVQAMSYIAFKEGYSKTDIGRTIKRDHATIINSIKQVENAFFTSEFMVIEAFNNITKEIRAYVGTLPENIKTQINTKSGISSVWNEAKNYRAI
jgi:hypothetical protein